MGSNAMDSNTMDSNTADNDNDNNDCMLTWLYHVREMPLAEAESWLPRLGTASNVFVNTVPQLWWPNEAAAASAVRFDWTSESAFLKSVTDAWRMPSEKFIPKLHTAVRSVSSLLDRLPDSDKCCHAVELCQLMSIGLRPELRRRMVSCSADQAIVLWPRSCPQHDWPYRYVHRPQISTMKTWTVAAVWLALRPGVKCLPVHDYHTDTVVLRAISSNRLEQLTFDQIRRPDLPGRIDVGTDVLEQLRATWFTPVIIGRVGDCNKYGYYFTAAFGVTKKQRQGLLIPETFSYNCDQTILLPLGWTETFVIRREIDDILRTGQSPASPGYMKHPSWAIHCASLGVPVDEINRADVESVEWQAVAKDFLTRSVLAANLGCLMYKEDHANQTVPFVGPGIGVVELCSADYAAHEDEGRRAMTIVMARGLLTGRWGRELDDSMINLHLTCNGQVLRYRFPMDYNIADQVLDEPTDADRLLVRGDPDDPLRPFPPIPKPDDPREEDGDELHVHVRFDCTADRAKQRQHYLRKDQLYAKGPSTQLFLRRVAQGIDVLLCGLFHIPVLTPDDDDESDESGSDTMSTPETRKRPRC